MSFSSTGGNSTKIAQFPKPESLILALLVAIVVLNFRADMHVSTVYLWLETLQQ